jgi:MoaA/NifB/PqqE/SkfB family radical SAM enzyme
MKSIIMPSSYNYIGVFLTFACPLNCSYCINNFEERVKGRNNIPGTEWVRLLNRIESPPDLPVTLQGGEPGMHPDLIYIINNLKPELTIDILTNLQFDIDEFVKKVNPQRVKRPAPYASIRVSYHPQTMDLDDTISRTLKMLKAGFSIGIWSVLDPVYESQIREAEEKCLGCGIDFRTKELLGKYRGKIYGTYRYADACSMKFKKRVLCKTTELLVDPAGFIFRCHHDLYKKINPIGSLFNPNFQIQDIYRDCDNFGFCNPCDIKVKTNRFQQYGHTSVSIRFL